MVKTREGITADAIAAIESMPSMTIEGEQARLSEIIHLIQDAAALGERWRIIAWLESVRSSEEKWLTCPGADDEGREDSEKNISLLDALIRDLKRQEGG